jgi:hypothetical protein
MSKDTLDSLAWRGNPEARTGFVGRAGIAEARYTAVEISVGCGRHGT